MRGIFISPVPTSWETCFVAVLYSVYMNTIFSSHHYKITEDDQEYATEKAMSLEKFVTPETEMKIEFSKDSKHTSGDIFRTDMTATTAGDRTHAVGHGSTMREAIDKSKDELKRRLTREKGKITKITRKVQAKIKKAIRA